MRGRGKEDREAKQQWSSSGLKNGLGGRWPLVCELYSPLSSPKSMMASRPQIRGREGGERRGKDW